MPGTIVDPPESMIRTSRGRVPSSDVGRIHTIRRSRTRTLTPFRRDGPAPSARAASRYTMGRSAAIGRRDALWALEGSVRFDHDGLAVRTARNWDAFRTARLARGNGAHQKRERGSEGPFLRSFVQLYPSSRKTRCNGYTQEHGCGIGMGAEEGRV